MACRGRCGGIRGVAGCRGGCFHDGAECGACCLPFGRSSFDVLCCTHKEQDCRVNFGFACGSLDMEMDVCGCHHKGNVLFDMYISAAFVLRIGITGRFASMYVAWVFRAYVGLCGYG